MSRASLTTAVQAHTAIHDRIMRDPDALTFDVLITWLDLLAHIERVDVKLARSVGSLAEEEGHEWTEEQRSVMKKYVRDSEARKARRNAYIAWSLMLRRHYVNTLLTRAHEESRTSRQSLTPLLTSHIYPLFPPFEINDYSRSPHLFVRNTEEGEKALVDKTVEAYEDIIVSCEDNGDWRPSHLPHAKPLQMILDNLRRYVQYVRRASRRLKRAFPDTNEMVNGQTDSAQEPLETNTSERPQAGGMNDKVTVQDESTKSDRKNSSRRRQESRATRAVLAFFGDYVEPAHVDKGAGSEVVERSTEQAQDTVDAIQVEVATGVESEVSLGSPAWSASVRGERDVKTDEQDAQRDRPDTLAVRAPPQPVKTEDAFPSRPLKRKRMSMPGYDIIERRVRERSRMLSVTPARERRDPEVSRSESRTRGDLPSRVRRASMGSQTHERTPAPLFMRAPTSEREEPPIGSVCVPSPGMRFEMDAEGRLVYIGMAEGASSPATTTLRTPEVARRSLQKVKDAAGATRGGQAASPATGSARRGFVKPLVKVRGVKVEEEVGFEGEKLMGGERLEGSKRDVVSGNSSGPSLSKSSDESSGAVGHGEARLDIRSSSVRSVTTTDNARNSRGVRTTPTTTTTTTSHVLSRKRPAPFDDSTVQRVPPGYHAAGRRLSSSEVAAAAFSHARRGGSGRR